MDDEWDAKEEAEERDWLSDSLRDDLEMYRARVADATAKAEEALGSFYVAYSGPPERNEECMATLRSDLVSLLAILKGGE